jgi:uncharacterized membrane protein required for colicin V production
MEEKLMDIILLMIVIVFLGIMFFAGYSKGIIQILFSFVATIVAFVLAMMLSGPIETVIKKTPMYDSVKEQMSDYVTKQIEDEVNTSSIEAQKEAIKKLNMPSVIEDKLITNNTSAEMIDMGVNSFSEYIATYLANVLVQALSVIVMFLIIKIILRIVTTALNIVSRLPVIKEVNKSLGGIVGLAEGVLVLWVACLVLTAFAGTSIGQNLLAAISDNGILNFIYSNNIIMKMLL